MHTQQEHTTLGELITTLYDEFMAIYDDEELASVAVAATINDLLTETRQPVLGQAETSSDAAA